MPKLKRFRMRRKPMINKSKEDVSDTTCKCPNVLPILASNTVRMQSATVNEDDVGAACSLVSIVKHKIHNVCTWQKVSLDDVYAEGTTLVKDIAKCKGYGKTLLPFKFSEQYCIFNKMCRVSEGQLLTRGHEELYETLQEIFLNYESCLVKINRQTCAIIRCSDVYAVVDCNVRDASGLGSNIGTAVVVFNTNWQDLFWHVNNLMESLSANKFWISGINVEVTLPDMLPCVKNDVVGESSTSNAKQSVCSSIHRGDSRFKEVTSPDMLPSVNNDVVGESSTSNARQSVCSSIHRGDSRFKEVTSPDMLPSVNNDVVGESSTSNARLSVCGSIQGDSRFKEVTSSDMLSCVNSDVVGESSTSNARQSVCGSFHQGDSRLKWPGKQCVAISLAAMAMHSVHNVFSWETKDLDHVLTIGDNLYGYLHENNCISDPKPQKWLCVPDLPCEYVFNEKRFMFEYGKCVSGFVDMNDGELITAGVCVPLVHGLQTMFEQYETCFLTLNGNTCAIIKQNGQFAVIDSHARSRTGIPDSDGLSVIVYYNSLSCVLKHIENFAACVGGKMKEFEISGLHVIPEKSSKVSVRQSENKNYVVGKKKKMGKKKRSFCSESLEDERESKVVKTKKEHFMKSTNTKTISDCDLNSDVICVQSRIDQTFQFNPLCHEVKQKLSSLLHEKCHDENVGFQADAGPLGCPCKTVSIIGDGSCFFRAVSQAVCGTQNAHKAVRLAVVKDMELHSTDYKNMLRCEYTSMEDYLSTSRMKYVGSWATEVEIQATANYLGVDIYTYHNEKWLKYGCVHDKLCEQGIYLLNSNDHYEVVICVRQPKSSMCYQLCQNSKQDEGNTKQSVKVQSYVKHEKLDSDAKTDGTGRKKLVGKKRRSQCLENLEDERECKVVKIQKDDFVESTKNTKTISDCDLNSDVICVEKSIDRTLNFNPLCHEVKQKLSSLLHEECHDEKVFFQTDTGPLGCPCKIVSVIVDGNNFFRAVSQAVCNTQKAHRAVRLAVVKEMELHCTDYKKWLNCEYTSIEEYLSTSRMKYVGSWATEVEIQATANYLGVDIYIYHNEKWLKYSCVHDKLCKQGIYLQHSNDHYEVVICVRQPKSPVCYQLCQNSKQDEGKYMCTRQSVKAQINVKLEKLDSDAKDGHSLSVNRKSYLRDYYLCKRVKSKYYSNEHFQKKLKTLNKERYHTNVLYNESLKKASKRKYKENKHHKLKVNEYNRVKYHNNEQYKLKVIEYNKVKYRDNEKYRYKVNDYNKVKYRNNEKYRHKVNEYNRVKYHHNEKYRHKVNDYNKVKYHSNEKYRHKVNKFYKVKYRINEKYRHKLNEYSKAKYRSNEKFRLKVNEYNKLKYLGNVKYRSRMKKYSIMKYRTNDKYQNVLKQRNKIKYQNNALHKESVQKSNKKRKKQLKVNKKNCEFVKRLFEDKVSSGLEFVCCVCHRLFFKQQVLCCKRDSYKKNPTMLVVANKCITEQFLHKCGNECPVPCGLKTSSKGQLWICFTCHYKINKSEMPAESAINNLELQPIPEELRCLNSLEQHLISLHIPFMKMLALPKGGQNGVHGPITCVPANVKNTTNVLPRTEGEGSLVCVKLKRKLTYKGHYKYQYVDTSNIKQALCYLKQYNKYYSDIEFNQDWINEFSKQDNVEDDSTAESEVGNENDDEELHDRQQHCVFMDTCLQPVDIGQEVLDQYSDSILSVAPSEGNYPVKMLADETNEAKCFPVLFPNGSSTYCNSRVQRLTLSRYFNNRIMHADGRFAQNVEYIFYAQYLSEIEQVKSTVSIALRKGKGFNKSIRSEMFKDTDSLRQVLNYDEGYRFLKPIRGTPSFWQGVQKDLFAMVRQLGIPTWFCSFSSADMRWTSLMSSILKQQGRHETLEQLEWADKCELLRRNPVTAARMFDFRWHCFLREVLMSPVQPIGEIVDYFYRVEFQQRGSPHVHCLFWIKNAPQIDKSSDEEVVEFVEKYVTCEVSCENEELNNIVTSVQLHSKHHSKTCKKKSTVCRFNFPKPPTSRTFICRRKVEDESDKEGSGKSTCENNQMKADYAQKITSAVKTAVLEEKFKSVENLFEGVGINQELFEMAYRCVNNTTHVVLKRQLNEVWVNQYNKFALLCWNANMDIQYVTDAYACIVYIISYISKSEREMGLLLANAQREATTQGNVDAKQALKKLGGVYLHNREISSQEAVYRLTNMHLKECSRNVQFIPTGDDSVRMSLPLSVIQNKLQSQTLKSEEMWMTSLVDRYKNRPRQSVFDDMCLATFASEYRITSKGQSPKEITLDNNLGSIVKRTRTQPAVVRYARFSVTKNPEKFYQSLLQLFFPYRADMQLKPEGYTTYEHFYKEGDICLGNGLVEMVQNVVNKNRALYEKDADVLDTAQNTVNTEGILESAWCSLCPEQQVDHLECKQVRREIVQEEEDDNESIPDLADKNEPVTQVTQLHKKENCLSRVDGLSIIRSLNKTQMAVFNKIRQWCLGKIRGENIKPFHLFITGGAGTGKSHLIKAIKYESSRLLSQISLNPDDICVALTAPTGIAAYNLKASTIHNTFSIGTNVKLPYTPLGEDKLNSLRAKFHGLQILIIDEVSMVDHKLLAYIHGRLRQIKQSGDLSAFGNVSVIAVGDFFQLPPVKGKPLYVDIPEMSLWSCFSVVELTQVVRQKDSKFAEMLNRLRQRSKTTALSKDDLTMLSSCDQVEEDNASLHIFATNDQVHMHNLKQVIKTCPEIETIEAEDYARSKKTGKIELIAGHHVKVHNTCLPEKLLLGIDARVMLMKNIDVEDGLVNGVCGVVTHIIRSSKDKLPETVYVKFDDSHVGLKRQKQCSFESAKVLHSTPIYVEEENVCTKGGFRRQFPLKLAWACTVHKVQGLTVDTAVVSLKKVFAPGQAYVALSRVRTLSGLIIKDFSEKAIFCNDKICEALQDMPSFMAHDESLVSALDSFFSVFILNVQSLRCHKEDLNVSSQQLQSTCIAVTETWLPEHYLPESVHLENYNFVGVPRCVAYTSKCPPFNDLKLQQHGGVGVYTTCGVSNTIITIPNLNLECLLTHFPENDILLGVIYRPQTYPLCSFKENMAKLIDQLPSISNNIVLVGDFNNDALKSNSMCSFMADRGFIQHVKEPTTEKGTLIDHVYIKRMTNFSVHTNIVPVYFSTHEGILCSFKL